MFRNQSLLSKSLKLGVLILLLLGSMLALYRWKYTTQAVSADSFFKLVLADTQGKLHPMQSYRGKILLLNFWATWCPPCREEIPELMALQRQYGNTVSLLGIAIDNPQAVQALQKHTPMSYPVFIAETQGMSISEDLQNTENVIPYSVLIDTHGYIYRTYRGRIQPAVLAHDIDTLQQHPHAITRHDNVLK